MSGISHFKDENSQKPWFMHAWSETKEREMLTFTGNIKGQCGNRALRANWLPVPVICPYNRDEILIFCHLFSVEMRRGSLFFFPSLSLSSQIAAATKNNRIKWSRSDGNVNSKSFPQFKSDPEKYSARQHRESLLCFRHCVQVYKLSCPPSFLYQRVN